MKRKIISVYEVNSYVSRLLEEDYLLSDLWIQGEVSNCKYHHSGHIYFTIKDERASINAVMFERDARGLQFKLTEGLKIYANVRISLYEKTGGYQAYVRSIEQQGRGLLYERFERLKAALAQEGLFDEAYKKPLPAFPRNVGVITSHTGAAIKDILQVAKRRNPAIPITIYSTHVQGELAPGEIVKALELANKEKRVDVIILGRGGGSMEDLWAFNDEKVARAIFASELPVVSAVGHEIDFTIADFVSDKRAATPSAAAEIVFPSRFELEESIRRYEGTMRYVMAERLRNAKKQLEYITSRPVFEDKARFYQTKLQETDYLVERLNQLYKNQLIERSRMYELALQKLEKLSPLNTLKRGYSILEKDHKMVRSVNDVTVGDTIEVTLSDGKIKAAVSEKET